MARRSTLTGDRALIQRLTAGGEVPTGRLLDVIMVDAMEPLRSDISYTAPRPSLRRGVVTARRAGGTKYSREFWVSFRRGLAMQIAHLVEFGTFPHSLAKGASRRKNIMQDVPPFHPGTDREPFMRPAFERRKDNILQMFARKFMGYLTRVVKE